MNWSKLGGWVGIVFLLAVVVILFVIMFTQV
jgi:hypothetical protein